MDIQVSVKCILIDSNSGSGHKPGMCILIIIPTIREVQIKTTMRYQFTATKLAVFKKIDKNKCWQGYIGIRIFTHCWWDGKWCSHFGNSLEVPQVLT